MTLAPLSIEVRYTEDEATLTLSGELDISSLPTLRSCINTLDDHCRVVTLDLAGLTFLDSTGIGFLVRLHQAFVPEFRDLLLKNATDQVRHVLEIAGAAELFQVP
jgi:anti-sigma B factor antagonist